MSQGLEILDEALTLAHKEKTALEDGAYEEAIELAEKRGQLTSMAWNLFESGETASWKTRLMELSKLQEQLTGIASRAQDVVRQRLNRARMEKKRIKGYHLAVGQALQ